ncbi:MAG TPA: hypothetical protein V6D11_11295 [Waterburya sp.]|jgi:N6-adenosine-specific RNA methylase IME4
MANRLGDALGGPKIELFARESREGWDAWGKKRTSDIRGYKLIVIDEG